MKKVDFAYIAGIVDGEGSIGIYNRADHPNSQMYMRVTVGNTEEWLLQWLKFNFGGYISTTQHETSGNRKVSQWTVTALKALYFLELILPYLRIKRPQAEIAIEFQKRRKPHYPKSDEQRAVDQANKILIAALKHPKENK